MKQINILIKKVDITEVEALQQISRKTFYETFEAYNKEENMQKYLQENFSISQLKTEINHQASHFYFALYNEEIAGYLKVNFAEAQTELQEKTSLEIERIYILQHFQDRGVGKLLFDKALQIALENDCKYLWLGVWEHNTKAIAFYEKAGFIAFGKHIFKLGDEEQNDIMMKKILE